MSDTKKKKLGPVGTLLVVLVAVVGILCLGKLCLNIIKDGKVDYIMDMGRNSGSKKDASMAGEKGYEDTKGRLQDGTEGTTLLELKDELVTNGNLSLGGNNEGNNSGNHGGGAVMQSAPNDSYDYGTDSLVAGTPESDVDSDMEGSTGESANAELTGDEIDILVDLARYLTASEGYMGMALDQYNLPINDEIAMTTIDIISNEYMSGIPDAEPFVITDSHDGSKMTVSKADIDAYVKNVFGYEGLSSYSYAGVQDNGDACDIWLHEGVRESTSGFTGSYMEGDIYVVTGGINVNASSGDSPFFVKVDYTLRVRRNSESPIGFTFVELQLGTAEPQY